MRWLTQLGLLLGVLVAGLLAGRHLLAPRDGLLDLPDPTVVASASLSAVQAQNQLTVFAARFTTAVTSRVERLGLSAEKTLIVPGDVRYELHLGALTRDSLRWNAASRTLLIDVPQLRIAGPEVDLARIREYQDGKLLMALGNTEAVLDRANRAKIREALLNEARAPILLKLAREAGRNAVERSFALPLRAAGIEAQVMVRYPDEVEAGS